MADDLSELSQLQRLDRPYGLSGCELKPHLRQIALPVTKEKQKNLPLIRHQVVCGVEDEDTVTMHAASSPLTGNGTLLCFLSST